MNSALKVREAEPRDVDTIAQYWLHSDPAFLTSLGVDLSKLPTRDQFTQMLLQQISAPLNEKRSYCLIWEENNLAIGHCNTNPTVYGEEAYLHLHLWKPAERKRGLGAELLSLSLPYFFRNLKLKRLYSKPYALNVAPSKTLQKVGFKLIKEYTTTPGSINFEQPVKRWELTSEKFNQVRAKV